MTLPIAIEDPGTQKRATVTNNGELVVGPVAYSTPIYNLLDTNGAGVTFFNAIAGKRFVITTIVADADRNVGANGVTVQIYEAADPDSATVAKTLIQFDMVKQTSKIITGLTIITNTTVYVNAQMDDNNVALTIAGYYVNGG